MGIATTAAGLMIIQMDMDNIFIQMVLNTKDILNMVYTTEWE